MKRLIFIPLLFLTLFCNAQFTKGGGTFLKAGNAFVTVTAEEPPGPPACLSTNTWAWYISTDSVYFSAGTSVKRWGDFLNSTHDLLQTSGAIQPTRANAAAPIVFDGSDDVMQTATDAALDQPLTIYIVFQYHTWTDQDYIYDGYTQDGGILQMRTTTGTIRAYAGSGSPIIALAADTYCVSMTVFNGASSEFSVEAVGGAETTETGNFGAGEMNGVTLANLAGLGRPSDISVYEFIIRTVDDSDGDELAIKDYLKTKYGI